MRFADLADDELMMLAKEGSYRAFGVLVRRHQNVVIAFTRRRLACLDRAKDAAQHTFVDLFRSLGRYRPSGKFSAFLFRIAANRCRMAYRSHARTSRLQAALAAIEPHHGQPIDAELIEGERLLLLRRGISALSPKLRSVVELRLAGLSYEEIAEDLDLPLGTVKSRLSHGGRRLREWFATAS